MEINSAYIHQDSILESIYIDAVNKYMSKASEQVCFSEVCQYVYRKLVQKKQSVYDHSIMIVKEVCQKIGEDFTAGVQYNAPDAKNYRDIYFSIYG
jgi:4-alpha-glucanotransferase